ncbi:hypothetical protein Hdeb2414_s0023g00640451 [Helianthus debilis subsp. tardiflorus]
MSFKYNFCTGGRSSTTKNQTRSRYKLPHFVSLLCEMTNSPIICCIVFNSVNKV